MTELGEKLQPILKLETADLHHTVEHQSAMHRLVADSLTRDEYIFILRHLHSFYKFIEDQVINFPELVEHIPDLASRFKVELLEKDLDNLGPGAQDVPLSGHDLNVTNLSEAFGIMYVIEGSSLGSQLILKQLQKKTFGSTDATNFFSGYGAQTGLRWRNFLSFLEKAFSSGLINRKETVRAARRTFEALNFSIPQ